MMSLPCLILPDKYILSAVNTISSIYSKSFNIIAYSPLKFLKFYYHEDILKTYESNKEKIKKSICRM